MVCTDFIHDDLLWKPVGVNGVFEKSGNHPFISTFVKHEINGVAKFVVYVIVNYGISNLCGFEQMPRRLSENSLGC